MLKKGPVNIAHSSWIMRKHLVQWRGKKKTVTLCPSWELKRQNTKMSSYLHFVLPQHSQAFLELSVFLGWEFCNNVLQLSFCFTLREVTHLVVLRGNFHQPGKEGKSTVTNCLPCFLVGKKKKKNTFFHIHEATAGASTQQIWNIIVRGHTGGTETAKRIVSG